MKIYHDSTYVNPASNAKWLSLSVINMWDLDTKPCCAKGGILFCLKNNTAISATEYKSEVIQPDESQKAEILKMGYNCL